MFAYREVPQDSTGFSPFELLYGRSVRGPINILRELRSGSSEEIAPQSSYSYVFELRNKLEETCELVRDSLEKSQKSMKKHFDKKAKVRRLEVNDKVLVMLPTDSLKLLMQWKGPFVVEEVIGNCDYRVKDCETVQTG